MLSIASIAAFCLISIGAGFAIGINLRGNPPKRTRKMHKLTAPHGQPEKTNE